MSRKRAAEPMVPGLSAIHDLDIDGAIKPIIVDGNKYPSQNIDPAAEQPVVNGKDVTGRRRSALPAAVARERKRTS
jgi:hypothetical protein